MEQIEKILCEITRLKRELDGYTATEALDYIESYINTLPEEHNEDLEEEISNYIKDNFFGSGSMGFLSNRTKGELDSIDVVNIARHFAEWQKQHMMKDAVEGEVCKGYVGNQIVVSSKDGSAKCVAFDVSYADAFCVGDKVRIIIVKED